MDDSAWMTNVPWQVDGKAVALALGLGRVHLLNDLVSIAHSVSVLQPDETARAAGGRAEPRGQRRAAGRRHRHGPVVPLQRRTPSRAGAVGRRSRGLRRRAPSASGSSSQWLTARFGRAEVEMVVSGIGLNQPVSLHARGRSVRAARQQPAARSAARRLREGAREVVSVLRRDDGDLRVGLRRRSRQPRRADRRHARPLHRRRHRAEEHHRCSSNRRSCRPSWPRGR